MPLGPALGRSFARPLDRRDKLTATNLLQSLEKILGRPKANWKLGAHSLALAGAVRVDPCRKQSG